MNSGAPEGRAVRSTSCTRHVPAKGHEYHIEIVLNSSKRKQIQISYTHQKIIKVHFSFFSGHYSEWTLFIFVNIVCVYYTYQSLRVTGK